MHQYISFEDRRRDLEVRKKHKRKEKHFFMMCVAALPGARFGVFFLHRLSDTPSRKECVGVRSRKENP